MERKSAPSHSVLLKLHRVQLAGTRILPTTPPLGAALLHIGVNSNLSPLMAKSHWRGRQEDHLSSQPPWGPREYVSRRRGCWTRSRQWPRRF